MEELSYLFPRNRFNWQQAPEFAQLLSGRLNYRKKIIGL